MVRLCESYRLMLTDSLAGSYHEHRYCRKYWHIIGVENEFKNVPMEISVEARLFY